RRDDDLQVRVRGEQRLRLLRADRGVVVAVDHTVEHQSGVLRILEGLLHCGDPGVLVGRRLRGRQDGDLAGAAGREVARPLGEAGPIATDTDDAAAITTRAEIATVRDLNWTIVHPSYDAEKPTSPATASRGGGPPRDTRLLSPLA